MKTILIASCFLICALSYAEEIKVEVTSFRFAGSRTLAAELCGKVTSDAFPIVAKVVVDPKTDKPGTYNAQADVTAWKLTTGAAPGPAVKAKIEN